MAKTDVQLDSHTLEAVKNYIYGLLEVRTIDKFAAEIKHFDYPEDGCSNTEARYRFFIFAPDGKSELKVDTVVESEWDMAGEYLHHDIKELKVIEQRPVRVPAIRAQVRLKSVEPISQKPEIASIGPFSIMMDRSQTMLNCDWDSCEGGCVFEGGHLYIDWVLREFADFSSDWRERYLLPDEISAKFIADSITLEEFGYECFLDSDETQHVEMKIVEFKIWEYNDEGFEAFDVPLPNK